MENNFLTHKEAKLAASAIEYCALGLAERFRGMGIEEPMLSILLEPYELLNQKMVEYADRAVVADKGGEAVPMLEWKYENGRFYSSFGAYGFCTYQNSFTSCIYHIDDWGHELWKGSKENIGNMEYQKQELQAVFEANYPAFKDGTFGVEQEKAPELKWIISGGVTHAEVNRYIFTTHPSGYAQLCRLGIVLWNGTKHSIDDHSAQQAECQAFFNKHYKEIIKGTYGK